MNRRRALQLALTSCLLLAGLPLRLLANTNIGLAKRRVRPSDPDWPSPAEWSRLKEVLGGRLIKIESPLEACADNPDTPACRELLGNLSNPFFLGDQPWATQT